jgi:hypothetical protein|tara:strand:- start:2515 stop:3021 length:507 start_codon:yes stop_codon:yes gene_type:complete
MGKTDLEIDIDACRLLQAALKLGYTPGQAIKVLKRSKTPKHFDTREKIFIFKKICRTVAAQIRKKKRGPKVSISMNQAYKDLCQDKKFKNIIERKEGKKFNADKFIKFLSNVWQQFPIDEKVVGIVKKKKPKGIIGALPYREFLIIESERIRKDLEDKNKNRKKPRHY